MKTKRLHILFYIFLSLIIIVSCNNKNTQQMNDSDKEIATKREDIKEEPKEEKKEGEVIKKDSSDEEMVEDIKESFKDLTEGDTSNLEEKLSEESKDLSKHIDSSDDVKDIETLRENIFGWYNLIQPGMTLEEIEGILGVKGVEVENFYGTVVVVFRDPNSGKGVTVGYEEGDTTIQSKQAYYSSMQPMSKLTTGKYTKELAEKIKEGMKYEEVKEIVGGEGLELIKFGQAESGGFRGLAWVNDDGSYIQVGINLADDTVSDALFNETGF